MFFTKKRRASGNCPSCRGDRLIYRSRTFNHAYFICQKCGFSLMVFDPWVPVPNAYAGDPKRIADLYNSFNHRGVNPYDERYAKKKLIINYLQQLKEKLQEAAATQNSVKEKLEQVVGTAPVEDRETRIEEQETRVGEQAEKNALPEEIEVGTIIGPDNEEYYSTTKAAEILGFKQKNGYQKVLRLIHKGVLSAKKPGRSYIVSKSELERYMAENNM